MLGTRSYRIGVVSMETIRLPSDLRNHYGDKINETEKMATILPINVI